MWRSEKEKLSFVLGDAYNSERRGDLCHDVTASFALMAPISHPESVV